MERLTLEKLNILYMLHVFGDLVEPFLNITQLEEEVCLNAKGQHVSVTPLRPTREHPDPAIYPHHPL